MTLNEIEVKLNSDLARITADLKSIAVLNPATDDWEAVPDPSEMTQADENNEADAVEEWNERRATLGALEIEYRDIKRALRKLKDGTYGICEISGQVIEPERLAAKPTARTCIAHRDEEGVLPL
jgi:DnaK suppressor protein